MGRWLRMDGKQQLAAAIRRGFQIIEQHVQTDSLATASVVSKNTAFYCVGLGAQLTAAKARLPREQ